MNSFEKFAKRQFAKISIQGEFENSQFAKIIFLKLTNKSLWKKIMILSFFRYFDFQYNEDVVGGSVELKTVGSETISDTTKHVSEIKNKKGC